MLCLRDVQSKKHRTGLPSGRVQAGCPEEVTLKLGVKDE